MPRPRPLLAPLPRSLLSLAREQHFLLTTAQLTSSGVDYNVIRSYVAAGMLHRIHRGVLSLVAPDRLGIAGRVTAARLSLDDGVSCLQTAAHLFGTSTGPLDPRVHVSFRPPAKKRQLEGVARHWLTLAPEEVTEVQGVPCTRPTRLIYDASKRWSRADLVSLVDGLLRNRIVAQQELADLRPRLQPAARAWVELADGRAESPLETRMRLLLHDAGLLEEFVAQWEVRRRSGIVIARIDFAVPSLRLGLECDGRAVHELPEALFRDRRRADDLGALGWRLIRVTWDDIVHSPDDVVRRIRRALAASA